MQPTRVGKTQGIGKLDVKNALPVKDAEAPAAGPEEGFRSQTITWVANAYLERILTQPEQFQHFLPA